MTEALPPAAAPTPDTALCEHCGQGIRHRSKLLHLPKLWVHVESDELECGPDTREQERAIMVALLADRGNTPAVIARMLGRSQSWVKARMEQPRTTEQ